MSDQLQQQRNGSDSAILPNNSLLPRGFGLHYIWTRLRVYFLLIAFFMTAFGAVAAAMVDLYGWTVLVTLFWLAITLMVLPKRVQLVVDEKLEKLDEKLEKLAVVLRLPPGLQTQRTFVIILIVALFSAWIFRQIAIQPA